MRLIRYAQHCIAWWAWAVSRPMHSLPDANVRDVYWVNTTAIWSDYYAREPRWEVSRAD